MIWISLFSFEFEYSPCLLNTCPSFVHLFLRWCSYLFLIDFKSILYIKAMSYFQYFILVWLHLHSRINIYLRLVLASKQYTVEIYLDVFPLQRIIVSLTPSFLNWFEVLPDGLRSVAVIFKHMGYVKVSCHGRNRMSCHAFRDPVFFMADTLLGVRKFGLCALPCCWRLTSLVWAKLSVSNLILKLLVDRIHCALPSVEGFSKF